MKSIIREALLYLPLDINKNITYDRQARKIIKSQTHSASNCIDIGCHKGEIMDLFLKYCPNGNHIGFEPIPFFYERLKTKYEGHNLIISDYCISDQQGMLEFNFVESNPAYSGILKRKFDRPNEKVSRIEVSTTTLDDFLPDDQTVDFIKIDVEGAEYRVLRGAQQTITQNRPLIVFEFGMGAADVYGVKPEMMYSLLCDNYGMKVGLMSDFLKNRKSLNSEEFKDQFTRKLNYYFVAWY